MIPRGLGFKQYYKSQAWVFKEYHKSQKMGLSQQHDH